MLNEPRTYRHSPAQFILVMVVLVTLGFVILTTLPKTDYRFLIFLAIFLGIGLVATLSTMMQKAIVSDDGISVQGILGEKSLRWGEISRASGRGHEIKLHNLDGDVTVSPSSQLPGYEEVVEWIGIKRPDLFDPLEYSEMKKGWFALAGLVMLIMFFVAILLVPGILLFTKSQVFESVFILLIFVIVIAIMFFVIDFSSPQSLTLDGKFLCMKYLFSEKTLLADEIASVDLRYSQNKNGKNYFVQLTQTNKKKVRVSGLNLSVPIVYLVLKNWYGKHSTF